MADSGRHGTGRTYAGSRQALVVIGALAAAAGTGSAWAAPWDWSKEHPLMAFEGDPAAIERTLKNVRTLAEDQLRERWQTRPPPAEAHKAAKAALTLWRQTNEERWQDLGVRCCRAALGDLLTTDTDELCARIDERGVKNAEHFMLRDACRFLAYLYVLTQEREHASRAARLLGRFAETIPAWKIYIPHYGDDKWSKAYPQEEEGFYRNWDATGLWGTWIYSDTHAALPLLDAYDLIHASGVLQEAGTLGAVEDMLRRHVRVQFNYGRVLGNMDGTQMTGILAFAKVLGEPEWVHACVRWIRDIYKTQFYADGWWHEGTPSYHKQIHHNLKGIFANWLQGYSDPPGFTSEHDSTRHDDLDLSDSLGGPVARADAALRDIQQPNRICQVLNDTVFPQPVWWAPPMQKAVPILFGCMGHAILGTGEGKGKMVQASLSYGGTHGHEHFDCLSLILFAKSHELIAETRYRPMNVSNTTREWHGMTAGHATVVVDGLDQTDRQSAAAAEAGCMRRKQPEDEIPGVPDSRWRWMGHGNAMNDGKLRLFNTDFEMVQTVQADGERSYAGHVPLDVYRRTLVLVKIDNDDAYVLDVFRVRGGTVHDYMLHSCLDLPHSAAFSLDLKGADGDPEPLHKYITPRRHTRTDAGWHVTFTMADSPARLRTFMLPQPNTEVIVGDGPAMRHEGVVPFIAVRQSDGESLFVAVHHPYEGESRLRGVEAIPLAPGSADAVAVRVILPDAVDTIIVSPDRDAPVRAADGTFAVTGRVAHSRRTPDGVVWNYLVDGSSARFDERTVTRETACSGPLTGTLRLEAGDAMNAFLTPAALPAGDELAGHTLMVDEAGLLVQSFVIERVHRTEEGAAIEVRGEPGMTITPGLIKLEYYPCWGIRGDARFRIAGSALARSSP